MTCSDAAVAHGDAVSHGNDPVARGDDPIAAAVGVVDMETVVVRVLMRLLRLLLPLLLRRPGGIPFLEVGVAQHMGDDVVVAIFKSGWGGGFHKVSGVIKTSLLLFDGVGDVTNGSIVVAVSVLVDRLVCPGPLTLVPPAATATADTAD